MSVVDKDTTYTRLKIDKFIFQKSEDFFTISDIPSTKDYYRFSFSKSEPFYKDFGKDIFVDCKYVFDDDVKKLKDLSNYEVKKRLEKYHYQSHQKHNLKVKEVMKIQDKILKLV